jgi:hypothetical protein
MHSVQPGGVERRDTRVWRHGSDDRFIDIVDKFSQVPHIKVDKFPVNRNALFSTRDLDETIQAWYHIEGDDHIVFQIGWGHFAQVAGIGDGSLLLLNAEARNAAICLVLVEIINP